MSIAPFLRRRTLVSLLAAGRFPVLPAFAQFRVEVSGVGLTQLPIAIAAFRGDAQAPQKIGAIVRADLERSGMFRPVDTTGITADENTRPDLAPGGKRARTPWSPAA
jgi:TolB protein